MNILTIYPVFSIILCYFVNNLGKRVEVVNMSDENSNLIEDMISIIYSFSARLYGSRRAKRIKEQAKEIIRADKKDG